MYNVKRSSDFMQIFTSLTLHHFYIQIWEDVERLGNYKEIRISSFLNSVFLCQAVSLPGYICYIKRATSTLQQVVRLDGTTGYIYSTCFTGSDWWAVGLMIFLFSLILEYFFMCHKKHQYQFIRQSCFLNYKNKPTLKCMFSMFLSEFREWRYKVLKAIACIINNFFFSKICFFYIL